MKTCPVCNALAFDDAKTCFGCLHSYERASERASEVSGGLPIELPACQVVEEVTPPPFTVRVDAVEEAAGAWSWRYTVVPQPRRPVADAVYA